MSNSETRQPPVCFRMHVRPPVSLPSGDIFSLILAFVIHEIHRRLSHLCVVLVAAGTTTDDRRRERERERSRVIPPVRRRSLAQLLSIRDQKISSGQSVDRTLAGRRGSWISSVTMSTTTEQSHSVLRTLVSCDWKTRDDNLERTMIRERIESLSRFLWTQQKFHGISRMVSPNPVMFCLPRLLGSVGCPPGHSFYLGVLREERQQSATFWQGSWKSKYNILQTWVAPLSLLPSCQWVDDKKK